MPTPFDEDGYSVTATTPRKYRVDSNIDLKTMISHVADLQTRGVLPIDFDAYHVDSQAWTTAATMAFKLQPLLVAIDFNNQPERARCECLQTITGVDGTQQPNYGFDLTRAQQEELEISWSAKLPKVIGHFTVFNESTAHLNLASKQADFCRHRRL